MNALTTCFHCKFLPEGRHCFNEAVVVSCEEEVTSIDYFINAPEPIKSPNPKVRVKVDFLKELAQDSGFTLARALTQRQSKPIGWQF
jgi:hypothetical protein